MKPPVQESVSVLLFLLLFLFLPLLSAACGGGADIGQECDTAGSTDQCVGGAICTNEEADINRCREICDDDLDCPAMHSCNGVSGSSTKSCQPD